MVHGELTQWVLCQRQDAPPQRKLLSGECAALPRACRATYMPRNARRQEAHLGKSMAVQALCAASKASPGLPVLVLEDDVQVASFFALRVSRLISDIEVRSGGAGHGGLRLAMSCISRNLHVHAADSAHAPLPGRVSQVFPSCKSR